MVSRMTPRAGTTRRHASYGWWAHQDLNLEPTNYEFAALTN